MVIGLECRLTRAAVVLAGCREVRGCIRAVGPWIQSDDGASRGAYPLGRDPVVRKVQTGAGIDDRHAALIEIAVTLRQRRDVRQPMFDFARSQTFDVGEKERGSRSHRAAERAAEQMTRQRRPRFARGLQMIARVEPGMADEVVERSVPVPRAGSQHHVDMSARAAAVLRGIGVLEQRDLLNRLDARGHDQPADEQVVVVESVEQEAVRRFACSGDVEPAVALRRQPGTWCWRGHAGRVGRDPQDVAVVERQRRDRLPIEDVTHGSGAEAKRRGIGGHDDLFGKRTGRERERQRRFDTGGETDVANHLGLESGERCGERVRACRKCCERGAPPAGGRDAPHESGGRFRDNDGYASDGTAGGVSDLDNEPGRRRLREPGHRQRGNDHRDDRDDHQPMIACESSRHRSFTTT